ncbi:MAG TPA: hypothetical protein VGM77_01585 [Gemmatimonadales bacterium]
MTATPPTVPPRRRSPIGLILGVVIVLAAAVAVWLYVRAIDSRQQVAGATVAHQMAQSQTLTTEKDSLLAELLETTTLLSDINQAVSAVQGGRSAPLLDEGNAKPLTAREARAVLLPKIDSLRARLDTVQARLASSLARVHQLSGTETQLRNQIAEYERTVASVRKLLAAQQDQVAQLGTQVESLRAENQKLLTTQTQLVATQSVLQDSVLGLRETQNTVYWIAGSRSALLELGVATEEGSGKVLIFGKGKTLAVGRDFRPEDFTAINKLQTASITLPKPNVRYRILSRQNVKAVTNMLDHDGHVRGTLQISDPASFWEQSPYLVLVEDN